MNILIIVGSQRKNGNTDQLIGLIGEQLTRIAAQNSVNLELETIHLGDRELGMCRGCRVCFDRGEDKCPLKDDLLAIKAKMQAADGVIIASPVYVDDVSGVTKNFIDRLAHVCHRPEFAGKAAYLLATVGSSPTSHTLGTLRLAFSTWGFHIVGQAGFKMGALMSRPESRAQLEQKAAAIARRFFRAVHIRAAERPAFFSLMMFKIQQRSWMKTTKSRDSVDYQYWLGKGWLDPRRAFYIPQHASPLKVALARLVGGMIAPFVS